jgi:hypothetical protein
VFFLVYVSAAVTWFSESELRALLERSRARNEATGITGMLLYKDGNFMQVLEGEESAVRAVHARIAADLRHYGMVTIDSGPQSGRQFPDWTMGFTDLSGSRDTLPRGYSHFLQTPLSDPVFSRTPGHSRQLLGLFRALE